jgi:hypothetical protein
MKKVDCIIIEKDDLNADGKSFWDVENYKEIKYHNVVREHSGDILMAGLVFLEKKNGSLHLLKNRYMIEL